MVMLSQDELEKLIELYLRALPFPDEICIRLIFRIACQCKP